jgi:hypothetical protein
MSDKSFHVLMTTLAVFMIGVLPFLFLLVSAHHAAGPFGPVAIVVALVLSYAVVRAQRSTEGACACTDPSDAREV